MVAILFKWLHLGQVHAVDIWWLQLLQDLWCSSLFSLTHLDCIMNIWEDAENRIGLLIRDGNSSLWWENWTLKGCLFSYSMSSFTSSNQNLQIKDVIEHNEWTISLLQSVATTFNIHHLQKVSSLLIDGADWHIWKPDGNDKFSIKSSLQVIRRGGSLCFKY